MKYYLIENKNTNIKPKTFISHGNSTYKEYTFNKKFKLPKYHLKNLYYKLLNSLIPKSLSEIFEYANSFKELGPLAKGY